MRLHRRDRTLHKETEFSQLSGIFADQIRCWVSARTITDKQTGDPVTLWQDMSPRAYDFMNVTGNAPTYNADGLNGYPSVRFTAGVTGTFSTDLVSASDSSTSLFAWYWYTPPGIVSLYACYGRTVAMVYVPRSTNTGTMLSCWHSFRDHSGGPHPDWWVSTTVASCTATANLTIGEPYLLVASNHGVYERYWINGVPQNCAHGRIWYNDQSQMNPRVQLGGGTYDVGEIFLARYSVGPKELSLLHDYFARKYSMTIPTPTWPSSAP